MTREHLHSIVYLPVIDQKALISFIVQITTCISFNALLCVILALSCIWAILKLGWGIISCKNLSVKAFKRFESWKDCVRAHWSRNPSVRKLEVRLKLQVSGTITQLGDWREWTSVRKCRTTINLSLNSLNSISLFCLYYVWICCDWKYFKNPIHPPPPLLGVFHN